MILDNLTRMIRIIKPMMIEANEGGGAGGAGGAGKGEVPGSGGAAPPFSWKAQLTPDYANSPTMQKFSDDKAGFNEAVKSHLTLEQLLGHEKVPIPKDENDKEGWDRFSKAMGIPSQAEQYGLPDAEIPESLKNVSFDKKKFSEIVHAHKLTPGQAKGLWKAYTEMVKDTYGQVIKSRQDQMTETVNRLRGEWGDAYDTNVELGQLVINKFASEREMQDWVTATVLGNPNGIKFLQRIGTQFAENKIGEFGYKRFSLTPDQAQSEIDAIMRDEKHPYNNDKSAPAERERAIDYVNSLYAILAKSKG